MQRHHFSSALQRMSAVAHVKGLKDAAGRKEEAVLRTHAPWQRAYAGLSWQVRAASRAPPHVPVKAQQHKA